MKLAIQYQITRKSPKEAIKSATSYEQELHQIRRFSGRRRLWRRLYQFLVLLQCLGLDYIHSFQAIGGYGDCDFHKGMQLLFLQFPKLVSGDVFSCGSYMVGLEMIMVMVLWLRMYVSLDLFQSSSSTNKTHRLPVRDTIFSDWISFCYWPCITFYLWASHLSRVFGTI